MLPDCSREYQLKKILGGACPQTPLTRSRLRRSIGKFQFLAAKPNPMPGFRSSYSTDSCLIHLSDHILKNQDKGQYTGMVI